jgi:hypothetical protein
LLSSEAGLNGAAVLVDIARLGKVFVSFVRVLRGFCAVDSEFGDPFSFHGFAFSS